MSHLKASGKFPCAVCSQGVGAIQPRCNILSGRLRINPEFVCHRCSGLARPIEVVVGDKTMDVVDEFCNLVDILLSGGGCTRVIIDYCKVRKLLPFFTSRTLPFLVNSSVQCLSVTYFALWW